MPTLHNLQLFLIPHTEALSRSSTTSARLYFLAGPRLITYLSTAHGHLTNASSILSCGAPQVPERISQVIDERKKAEKRVDDLEAELAEFISKKLVKQAIDRQFDANQEIFAIHIHRNDDTLGFLFAITTGFAAEWSSSIFGLKQFLVVLTSSPTSQTSTSTSLVVIFGSNDETVKEVGDAVKTKIGVKGGGKGNKWSGKFIGVWKDSKESAGIDEVLDKLGNH
jgi:misacylated tRNA(Ala) deacylase